MSSDTDRLIHLVDDDAAIRRSVGFMLKTSGYEVRDYESGVALLKSLPLAPGCVLMDIRMPGMDGLQVQGELANKGVSLPVVIMTGHGDVTLAVQAMKAGAVDFIEKPFEKAVLLEAIDHALDRLRRSKESRGRADAALTKLNGLTPREKQVLEGLAKGLPNKTIAFDLGISPRTVEIHRANLMAKLGVRSLSEALRIIFAAQEQNAP
jgi:two-component system, LuxR family, response regulator FixJ